LGADGRSVHVPFHGRAADKNDERRCSLRVQIYRIRFALVLCTLGNLFLERDVHVFRGRREGTFSDTRRTGRRSDGNRGRREIKGRDQTPSTGVEVSRVRCTVGTYGLYKCTWWHLTQTFCRTKQIFEMD